MKVLQQFFSVAPHFGVENFGTCIVVPFDDQTFDVQNRCRFGTLEDLMLPALKRIAELEPRRPHREILDIVTNIEWGGYEVLNPAMSRFLLSIPGFASDQIQEAIDQLIDDNILVERSHSITGEKMIGVLEVMENTRFEFHL